MNWTRPEINHIKVSLDRCDAQQLSNELGRAKENVEQKIEEIKANQRLSRLSQYVKKVRR
ncbi:hypothetical protein AKJ54_00285 [candidate division MSBL1 archaeon SCGC-AAA382K21]|uniref:Uncharacterized protein n=1 Tax=candidate division MSBL1 archaeon SCGC-AAA382K21 TaxID=1698283 RepID=A0A133VLV9_9EURY|nr:hypothetical protein AKJ54_00285 [candidate division MSBL1 archaeon SCGC-AAA382K21]